MSERYGYLYPSGKREVTFIGAALVLVMASVVLDQVGFCAPTSWFQRSGSLLVVLGAICESKYVAKTITNDVVALGSELSRLQQFSMHSGFYLALFGTVVWGYGDMGIWGST